MVGDGLTMGALIARYEAEEMPETVCYWFRVSFLTSIATSSRDGRALC